MIYHKKIHHNLFDKILKYFCSCYKSRFEAPKSKWELNFNHKTNFVLTILRLFLWIIRNRYFNFAELTLKSNFCTLVFRSRVAFLKFYFIFMFLYFNQDDNKLYTSIFFVKCSEFSNNYFIEVLLIFNCFLALLNVLAI